MYRNYNSDSVYPGHLMTLTNSFGLSQLIGFVVLDFYTVL